MKLKIITAMLFFVTISCFAMQQDDQKNDPNKICTFMFRKKKIYHCRLKQFASEKFKALFKKSDIFHMPDCMKTGDVVETANYMTVGSPCGSAISQAFIKWIETCEDITKWINDKREFMSVTFTTANFNKDEEQESFSVPVPALIYNSEYFRTVFEGDFSKKDADALIKDGEILCGLRCAEDSCHAKTLLLFGYASFESWETYKISPIANYYQCIPAKNQSDN